MSGHSISLRTRGRGAFTLVELLVSIAILSIILLVLASITAQTEVIWKGTSAKIEQFRSARNGFNTMTYRLSQATLNTYISYSDGTSGDTFYSDATFAPTSFVRQSELRFLSGSCYPTETFQGTMNGSATANPTHSVFFLAPLGYNATTAYQQLTQTLNVCGYYLQFGADTTLPAFFTNAVGYLPRYRYRLMELLEPSENNAVYNDTLTSPLASNSNAWVTSALGETTPPVHILAENIIALIILPQLGQDQISSSGQPFAPSALAPNYGYDSTTNGAAPGDPADAGALDSSAQLPPLVQVTMVAIDEPSAVRIQDQFGTTAPDFGINSHNLFQLASSYSADLDQLRANLEQSTYTDATGTYNPQVALPKKINYHIFTATVSIKGAQWSTIQTN